MSSATLSAADDEDNHDTASPTTPTDSATPAPKGKTVSVIDGKDGSTAKDPARSGELVQELQKLKLNREAAQTIELLLEKDKNANVDAEQFNRLIDAVAAEDPALLTTEQVAALKDLFRVELSKVEKNRGKELASAIKTVVDKLPAVALGQNGKDGKGGKTAGAGADANGAGNGKPPTQEELLKQFAQTVSKTLGDTAKQLLNSVQQGDQKQADALKKALEGQQKGEDPNLLNALRGLEKNLLDDRKRNELANNERETNNESPSTPDSSAGGGKGGDKAAKNDDTKDKLLDLLKDKKNQRNNASTNNSGGQKGDEKNGKEEKKEEKPLFERAKKGDDDFKPPPKKSSPEPMPSPTPAEAAEEAPVKTAMPTPPKYSDLQPARNAGSPDDGRFSFGNSSPGPSPLMPGAPPSGPSGLNDAVFDIGGGGMDPNLLGEMGGGRRQYGSSPGYTVPNGPDDNEEEGDGTVDGAPPAATRGGGAPSQIVVSAGDLPNTSAVAMKGTFGQLLCGDGSRKAGICEKEEELRQRKAIREGAMLRPPQGGL